MKYHVPPGRIGTRARKDALVIERIKEFAGNPHLDEFINAHRGSTVVGFLANTNMPTSHELLTMDINEFEKCQQRLARGEYDDAPVQVEPRAPARSIELFEEVVATYVYPTEVEFLAMTVDEINDWLSLPTNDSEVDSIELKEAVALANCIRRLRVLGILP